MPFVISHWTVARQHGIFLLWRFRTISKWSRVISIENVATNSSYSARLCKLPHLREKLSKNLQPWENQQESLLDTQCSLLTFLKNSALLCVFFSIVGVFSRFFNDFCPGSPFSTINFPLLNVVLEWNLPWWHSILEWNAWQRLLLVHQTFACQHHAMAFEEHNLCQQNLNEKRIDRQDKLK